MSTTVTKTIIATGASSGLGFELIKQLLLSSSPLSPTPTPKHNLHLKLILGARRPSHTSAAYASLNYDRAQHSVSVLPLELADLKTVRGFAGELLRRLGEGKVDYLLLNAGVTDGAGEGKGWCEALWVNHLSQHYLVHLLRKKLVESKTRVVFVSSGVVRRVESTESLEHDLKAGSGANGQTTYSQTKFVQLLGAHWWRRQLKDQCAVVAVSPGLVPGTGIGRGAGMKLTMDMPDAKTVPEGAQSILRAFTREDLPEDPEQIFLTSWGEWWSKEVYALTLDKSLQDKWCPSKEEIEREEGLDG